MRGIDYRWGLEKICQIFLRETLPLDTSIIAQGTLASTKVAGTGDIGLTQLVGDVANRVRRLPKPSNLADALQPIFEAVSNAVHAIHDEFGDYANAKGEVVVDFQDIKDPNNYTVIVSDNGVGMEPDRFAAFCTTDTPFKITRGGKGVGRLLWLDAFRQTHIESVFRHDGKVFKRTFDFGLGENEPIYNENIIAVADSTPVGTAVTMRGLRSNPYSKEMPVQFAAIRKHFASHFLADFLMGTAPNMTVSSAGASVTFPEDVRQMLVEERRSVSLDSETFGELTLSSYIMSKEASSDLDGNHQLHLVSSGRTVQTRKLDGLLGIKRIGARNEGVFHACLTGPYLDERVNQERTHFNFSEDTAAELTKECVALAKKTVLQDELDSYEQFRLAQLEDFVDHYPSFGFESPEALLTKTPASADSHEAFAASLIKHKIRADRDRRKLVQSALSKLSKEPDDEQDLGEEIREAARAATADENRQLMEYVLRRKFIIEILDALLGKVRALEGRFDTHLEDTFHELICPMRVTSGDRRNTEPVSHDLWLLDERLAPAAYFASDAQIKEFLDSDGKDRVDLMVWDKVHGLGLGSSERLERVILVEFKKPERGAYKGDYVLGRQMNRYMAQLIDHKVRSHNGDLVELSKDVVFHCYVVADIAGDLEMDTRDWMQSPSGRGKFKYLQGDFNGTMEVIEWKELVRDAKVRNQNFVEAARLSFTRKGDLIFPPKHRKETEAAE